MSKLCKKSADCDPSYDEETCLEEYEALEEATDELGCNDVLDDFVKCATKEGECVDGYIEPSGCTGEAVAYIDCFFGDSSGTFLSSSSDTGYEIGSLPGKHTRYRSVRRSC